MQFRNRQYVRVFASTEKMFNSEVSLDWAAVKPQQWGGSVSSIFIGCVPVQSGCAGVTSETLKHSRVCVARRPSVNFCVIFFD